MRPSASNSSLSSTSSLPPTSTSSHPHTSTSSLPPTSTSSHPHTSHGYTPNNMLTHSICNAFSMYVCTYCCVCVFFSIEQQFVFLSHAEFTCMYNVLKSSSVENMSNTNFSLAPPTRRVWWACPRRRSQRYIRWCSGTARQ